MGITKVNKLISGSELLETAIKFYHADQDDDVAVYRVFSYLAMEKILLPVNVRGYLMSLRLGTDKMIPFFTSKERVTSEEQVALQECFIANHVDTLLRAKKHLIINPFSEEDVQFVIHYEAIARMLIPVIQEKKNANDTRERKKEENDMGLFGQIVETMGEKKERKAREEEFVRNNTGSKAICAFLVNLFEKGNSGYNWIKKNRTPIYLVVNQDSVSLCYTQYGNGQSWSESKPKDIEVATYKFQEMYNWYGLSDGSGYCLLDSKVQRQELSRMINLEVNKLPHIKDKGGYLVKTFQ